MLSISRTAVRPSPACTSAKRFRIRSSGPRFAPRGKSPPRVTSLVVDLMDPPAGRARVGGVYRARLLPGGGLDLSLWLADAESLLEGIFLTLLSSSGGGWVLLGSTIGIFLWSTLGTP